jgi:hypothetical protein
LQPFEPEKLPVPDLGGGGKCQRTNPSPGNTPATITHDFPPPVITNQ